jgi:hypothetical protein
MCVEWLCTLVRTQHTLVQHVELFGGILSGKEHDGLLASGVILQKVGGIQNLAIDNNPTVLFSVVFGNVGERVLSIAVGGRRRGSRGIRVFDIGIARRNSRVRRRRRRRSGSSRSTIERDRDIDLSGRRRDVHTGSRTRSRRRAQSASSGLLEQVARSSSSSDTTKYNAIKQ